MLWHPCEVYVCSDRECRSKVLVLQEPGTLRGPDSTPTCVCGHVLERKPAGVSEPEGSASLPGEEFRRDPEEERE